MTQRLRPLLLLPCVLLFALAACGKKPAEPANTSKGSTSDQAPAQTTAHAQEIPVPAEEPSEAVLRKLDFARYEEIERAGGMPVTMTATGKSLTLHPKLYDVRKEGCKPTPQAPAGWYECDLIIKLSLSPDGSDPSEQGERFGVKWDSKAGEWVSQ